MPSAASQSQPSSQATSTQATSKPRYTVGENVELPEMGTLLSVPRRSHRGTSADTGRASDRMSTGGAAMPEVEEPNTLPGESISDALIEPSPSRRQANDTVTELRTQSGRNPYRQPGTASGRSSSSSPAYRPLHERLETFRHPAFDRRSQDPQPTPSTHARTQASASRQAIGGRPALSQDTPPSQDTALSEDNTALSGGNTSPNEPRRTDSRSSGGRPVIPRRALSGVVPQDDPQSSTPSAESQPTPDARPTPTLGLGGLSGQENWGSEPGGVLFAQRSPAINVQTFGPRKIAVGKESSYRFELRNSGDVAAEDVVVYIQLPAWADVLGAEASMGATQLPGANTASEPFLWKVGQLDAHGDERLVLRVVPRESRPFDLSVRWGYKPVFRHAMIEVQEPKLEMELEGPDEVLYGKQELYKLKLSNSGNGPAENVMITLMPVGGNNSVPASHKLGRVDPGEEKVVEVELTARQTGHLMIRVEVRGDSGAQAELAHKVLVRRAELALAVEGPRVRFVGADAEYRVVVANTGNAPAHDVEVVAAIPAGAKYVNGVEGAEVKANGTKIHWTIDLLPAEAKREYSFRTTLGLPGPSRLEVLASSSEDLTATAETTTRVEAMADLAMEVLDSTAPVAVGTDTTYELRVKNRGTKAAENVEVVAYFSRGIEPIAVEGAAHRIGPGQVVFSPIPTLGAGGEMIVKIRARAEQPGNHVFRAECYCKTLGTRLVSEETTHFYADGPLTATQPENTSPQR